MSFKHVKIYYGPCNSFDSFGHKPQKLYGLRDRLQKLGFRVELAPVEYVNYCVIELCGHEVFRCNIQNFKFNTQYTRDAVAQRAVNAILDASAKCSRARTYLWIFKMIEDQLVTRSEYGPKDYWSQEIEDKTFSPCINCMKCCGLLAFKKFNK